MKSILLLSTQNRFELTPLCDGIKAFGFPGTVNFTTIGDLSSPADVRKLLLFWKPAGCILHDALSQHVFDSPLLNNIPHVYIDRDPAELTPEQLCVLHDSENAGSLAAKELLSLELPNYAYAHFSTKFFWSEERESTFKNALNLHGKTCLDFSDTLRDSKNHRMKGWLARIPKPIGIFATNDGMAEKIAIAASELGIPIPDDIALIGVDDVCEICEKSTPTLTSIHPDFVRAGYLAAELLARKIKDPKLKGQIVRYGQTGVVRRQSTRRFPRKDPTVSQILEAIRQHATDTSLTIESLAQEAGCSRRYADMRFREVLRRTILDEIHEVRIETAKRLLENPSVRIAEAAAQSGFKSFATFSRVFTALVGMSPRDYRKRRPL